MYVNLTGKSLSIRDSEGKFTDFPSDGFVNLIHRIVEPGEQETIATDEFEIKEVSTRFTTKYEGQPRMAGLPDPKPGIVYIVQYDVLKLSGRDDFVTYGKFIKDNGKIIGYDGFCKMEA